MKEAFGLANYRKEDIIIKSLELFYKNGYQNTTLRKIGEAVGISHSSIMNNFKKKSDIASIFITQYIDILRRYTSDFCTTLLPTELYESDKELYFTLAFFSLHYKIILKDGNFSKFYYEFLNNEKTNFVDIVQRKGPIKDKYYSVLEDSNIKEINLQIMNNSIISFVDSLVSMNCSKMILNLHDAVNYFFKFYFNMNFIKLKIDTNEINEFLNRYIENHDISHLDIYNDFLFTDEAGF